MKFQISALAVLLLILLIWTGGCADIMTKAGVGSFGNASNGKQVTPTPVTIVPTGNDSTDTRENTVKTVPAVNDDVCVFGSKNCHLYEQCMAGCIDGGSSQTYCAKNICCSVKCMDMPTVEEKVACSNECLTGATGTT
jgi:hypothetical protein